jgi:hypothetical protein
MTSKISICSNALILLGDKPISNFDESGAGALAAANLYESSYLNILSMHRWRFATKKATLSRLTTKPKNQWQYQYQLPIDLVAPITTYPVTDYELYADKLYSNNNSCELDYVYRVDESQLPAFFIKTMEFYMAMQFAIPVTGNSQRMAEMQNLFSQQLKNAKNVDSTIRPNAGIYDSPLTEIRY